MIGNVDDGVGTWHRLVGDAASGSIFSFEAAFIVSWIASTACIFSIRTLTHPSFRINSSATKRIHVVGPARESTITMVTEGGHYCRVVPGVVT